MLHCAELTLNMNSSIIRGVLLVGICFSAFAELTGTRSPENRNNLIMPQVQEVTEVPGLDYLSEIGEKLGCHFTVEYRSYLLTGKTPKIRENVSNDLSISSLAALVAKLRRDLPGYTIATDPKD